MKKNTSVFLSLVVGLILVGIIAVALIENTLSVPDEWRLIDSGKTGADVERLVPGLDTSLRDVKADFAVHHCLLGRWVLSVKYGPDGFVYRKDVSFRLGTKEFYKEYHF